MLRSVQLMCSVNANRTCAVFCVCMVCVCVWCVWYVCVVCVCVCVCGVYVCARVCSCASLAMTQTSPPYRAETLEAPTVDPPL